MLVRVLPEGLRLLPNLLQGLLIENLLTIFLNHVDMCASKGEQFSDCCVTVLSDFMILAIHSLRKVLDFRAP